MKLPMFYRKKDSKSSIIIKYFLFWSVISLIMLVFFLLINKNDITIPQHDITFNINIKNKINICLPDEAIK